MSGRTPLVLIHGFTDTPTTWALVRPLVEPFHDVLAPATLGHHGGPALPDGPLEDPVPAMVDALERDMDAAGIERAHLVGSSLGGQIAIELAARGRALSVVGLAPGGGWEEEKAVRAVARRFSLAQRMTPYAARRVRQVVARPGMRKLALRDFVAHGDRMPPAVAAALIEGSIRCAMVEPMRAAMAAGRWRTEELDAVDVPVRLVWGTRDRILPIRHAAGHWRSFLTDHEWVELEDVGHLPQLDAPATVARLVLELTATVDARADIPATA